MDDTIVLYDDQGLSLTYHVDIGSLSIMYKDRLVHSLNVLDPKQALHVNRFNWFLNDSDIAAAMACVDFDNVSTLVIPELDARISMLDAKTLQFNQELSAKIGLLDAKALRFNQELVWCAQKRAIKQFPLDGFVLSDELRLYCVCGTVMHLKQTGTQLDYLCSGCGTRLMNVSIDYVKRINHTGDVKC